ncbi:hypothetical protein [Streptomyces albidoflavus]|uniref:hypothetical protein n=1 Tax=Streptomyces albidoflavus TaxID=1886 RepID=UPI0015CA46B3
MVEEPLLVGAVDAGVAEARPGAVAVGVVAAAAALARATGPGPARAPTTAREGGTR